MKRQREVGSWLRGEGAGGAGEGASWGGAGQNLEKACGEVGTQGYLYSCLYWEGKFC